MECLSQYGVLVCLFACWTAGMVCDWSMFRGTAPEQPGEPEEQSLCEA